MPTTAALLALTPARRSHPGWPVLHVTRFTKLQIDHATDGPEIRRTDPATNRDGHFEATASASCDDDLHANWNKKLNPAACCSVFAISHCRFVTTLFFATQPCLASAGIPAGKTSRCESFSVAGRTSMFLSSYASFFSGIAGGVALSLTGFAVWHYVKAGSPRMRCTLGTGLASAAGVALFVLVMHGRPGSTDRATSSVPHAPLTWPHMEARDTSSTPRHSARADGTAAFRDQVARNPRDAASWLQLAEIERRRRNFEEALAAYQQAIALDGMTADAWADYADVLASSKGRLSGGGPGEAIEAALRLQPRHPKALWLKASLALEERRYAEAAELWRRLRAVIPGNSPDAQVIDANIDEALRLSRGVIS